MVERAFPAEGVEESAPEFEPGKVSKGEHMIHIATLDAMEMWHEANETFAIARQLGEIKARLVELQGDPF